jgi:type IV pilus assembly protein PilV
MNLSLPGRCKQQGVMLLEALISILIFSIGILAIIGLQAASIKMSSDAKYRSDASLLAGQYVNALWSEPGINPIAAASAAAAAAAASAAIPQYDPNAFITFATGGAQFDAWLTTVQATLPDATADVVINTQVTCNYLTPCSACTVGGMQQETRTIADITITWQLPGNSERHTFATSAMITAQKMIC